MMTQLPIPLVLASTWLLMRHGGMGYIEIKPNSTPRPVMQDATTKTSNLTVKCSSDATVHS